MEADIVQYNACLKFRTVFVEYVSSRGINGIVATRRYSQCILPSREDEKECSNQTHNIADVLSHEVTWSVTERVYEREGEEKMRWGRSFAE